MPELPHPPARILVDNWLIAHAVRLLGPGLQDRDKYVYKKVDNDPYSRIIEYRRGIIPKKKEQWPGIVRNSMIALMQFLDLVAISDELIYDETWSYTWKGEFQLEEPLLVGLRIGEETRKRLPVVEIRDVQAGQAPDVVSTGTKYYLALAQFLGLYYWPTPERAGYLATHKFSSITPTFSIAVNEFVDGNLKDMVDQVRCSLAGIEGPVQFPGFGSAILAGCAKPADILPAILELRRSKECIAFRTWLSQMDQALQMGDVTTLAHDLSGMGDVVAAVERELGIRTKPGVDVKLQIGLSPSLNFDLKTLDAIWKGLAPRKLHLTFLRQHFTNVLRQADVWHTLQRLFPIIKDVRGVDPSG